MKLFFLTGEFIHEGEGCAFFKLVVFNYGLYWSFQSVVCRIHYNNSLKQQLNGTKAYEETSTDEKNVVNSHSNERLL